MNPKEKAWELFRKFKNIPDKWKNERVFQNYYAKECALTSVDEILELLQKDRSYYLEVKQEIEKL